MKTRRMPRGEGSLYERPDGTWCGQLDLGYDPVTGKRKRKTVYGATSDIALAKLKRARADAEAGIRETRSPTVEWWLRHWLDEIVADNVKPRTLATYRSYVEKHLIPALGKRKLERLDTQHIRELHRAMADKSSTTRMHAHRVLHTALEAARKERKITVNVADIVDAPRKRDPDRHGMSSEQARRVLTAALEVPMPSRWWAALMTGARQGELLGLRWQHVDLLRNRIDLAWALQQVPRLHGCGPRPAKDKPWPCGRRFPDDCPQMRSPLPDGIPAIPLEGRFCLMRPKTAGSIRVVPLLPGLAAALRQHRDVDTDANPHDLVWHRPDGAPIDPRRDLEAWHALLDVATVDSMTLHEARNTAATLMLEGGVDVKVIGEVLGQTLVVTTRAYQNVSQEMKERAIGMLGVQLGLPAALKNHGDVPTAE